MVGRKGQLKIQVCGNQRFPCPESSKAQLRIQEMSFMLVGVILFFILVGLFALTIMSSNLQKSADEILGVRVLSVVVELANSPEFNCAGGRSRCVDADKLMGLMKSTSYKKFWDFSSLEVIKGSGFDKSKGEIIDCNSENYADEYDSCDRFVIYDKKVDSEEKIGSFVAICRIEYENFYPYEKCEVGKLVVGRELK